MKKTLLLAALCVVTVMNAQTGTDEPAKRFRIGAEAGLSINNYTNSDRSAREGFYVGARGEYRLRGCYLSASLRLIRKGADAYTGDGGGDDFYEAYYMELPMSVGGSGRLGRKTSIFGETGPYVAVGVGGRHKGENDDTGVMYKWDDNFYSNANGNPRRFDAGWGIRGGISFSHVSVSVGYEIGFIPVWNVSDSRLGNSNHHNSSFTVGVAYMF